MADGGSNITFPPDVQCFKNDGFDPDSFKANNCTVSQSMVGYLNLTMEIEKYVSAYCANPPRDDNCPFEFCPNPDIAGVNLSSAVLFHHLLSEFYRLGPLVRIASEWMLDTYISTP
jgi:hypothetical protein